MATEIEAVYHNGVLELKSALPLKEGQTVWVIVQENSSLEDRVTAIHAAANAWLTQQSPVPEPPDYPPEEWARLDAEFEAVLAEIQQRAEQPTEDEIASDVEEALVATRIRRRQSAR